jgi:lycopene beta-cyclase
LAHKNHIDVAIVGGGLAGGLIACRLRALRPDVALAVFEGAPVLGGNHTWSFHETDLEAAALNWLDPFVARRWARQSVRFPAYERAIETPYCSIDSRRFHDVALRMLGDTVRLSAPVRGLTAEGVSLESGETIAAGAVIDARGEARSEHIALGFQKFIGQEIEFVRPHGLRDPIIMDATVPQEDGYRFLYVLPISETTALVEDTRYADGALLARDDLRRGVADYCAKQGWRIGRVLREEEGVLPIALAGDIGAYLDAAPAGVAQVGVRAALFHPLTGYSLPDAVALADRIAVAPDLSGPALAGLAREHAIAAWDGRGFYRLLARMLFGAAEPAQRYKVLQRFYRLPRPLIERFYAGATPMEDRARILLGKPPVPILRAAACVNEAAWLKRAQTA